MDSRHNSRIVAVGFCVDLLWFCFGHGLVCFGSGLVLAWFALVLFWFWLGLLWEHFFGPHCFFSWPGQDRAHFAIVFGTSELEGLS